MNNTKTLLLAILLTTALVFLNACGDSGSANAKTAKADHAQDDGHGHGDNDGHSHDEGDDSDHDEDDGHDHGDDDGHGHGGGDEHGEEAVKLTPKQLNRAGVRIEPLGGGSVSTHITLPAEVGLNLDTLIHVIPRVPGVVSDVNGYLGQTVQADEVLAVIESPELGEAKIAYLQAVQAKEIADAELARQKTISENTETLLNLLRDSPELDTLRERTMGLQIGENKGRLLSAYAKVKAANANYAREKELREKGLSTQTDLLAAQEAFNSNQAEYFAAFEDIDFTYRLRLQEAERAARVAASAVDNTERRLHLLGLSDEQVERIQDEPNFNVARYVLTAPRGGRIVAKHITPGEKVGSEEPVYTIADLSNVWLNISVYTQYADLIAEGQQVRIHTRDRHTTGVVDYVSPVVSEATRTVSARVVIDNTSGQWKPGEFVTARVETGQTRAERVVPLTAIQTYEGRDVVFVQDVDGIEPVPVRLGRRNDISVELLGDDIALGTPIVVENSFLMKAELGKSAAGHEH